jgi:ABC-type Co2+ transport system permease subunit
MTPNWGWCLKIGGVIVLVDLLSAALARGQAPDGELRIFAGTLDQLVNFALFAYIGYRTGRETGRVTAGAEAGVAVSILTGVVAALYHVLYPDPADVEAMAMPVANLVIQVIAINVVQGGITAWVASWLASRSRTPVR